MLVPCQACGRACDGCAQGCAQSCRAIGPCCKSITDCVANMCSSLDRLLCPRDRPKPLFLGYSIIIGICVIAMCAKGLSQDGDGCDTQDKWMYTGIAMAVGNFLLVIYVYHRFAGMIAKQREKETAQPVRNKNKIEKCCCGPCFQCCERGGVACELFCYDLGVFLYMCFLIGIIVWTVMAGDAIKDDGPCKDKSDSLDHVRLIWWIFLGVGACVLCVSVSCELGRQPDPQHPGLLVHPGGGYPGAYQTAPGQQGLLQHQQPAGPAAQAMPPPAAPPGQQPQWGGPPPQQAKQQPPVLE
eukprot:TRINITY_DN18334_c0_g1_i1.p2 TRINITY_DN18334_c0_g1~~TRINITY_DN18334_c0_g1_i1.p2  ORF type:complete len:330 (+),score=101.40 TRINITY_DN18334_c0_g1_i1:98-991(+)